MSKELEAASAMAARWRAVETMRVGLNRYSLFAALPGSGVSKGARQTGGEATICNRGGGGAHYILLQLRFCNNLYPRGRWGPLYFVVTICTKGGGEVHHFTVSYISNYKKLFPK